MPRWAQRLQKPEYFFRPSQLVRRLRPAPAAGDVRVRLACGLDLMVDAREAVGRAVVRLGIYDLVVSEAIWRLLAPGDRALDVGANLGCMTAVMAARVGSRGEVLAFEPHPAVFARLEANVRGWERQMQPQPVKAFPLALSDREGSAQLVVPAEFSGNQGLAHLGAEGEVGGVTIRRARLDAVAVAGRFTLMKMDVEGHEERVLAGAGSLVTAGRITHILFEALDAYPTSTAVRLERCGYTIFGLGMRFRGPRLMPPSELSHRARPWLPQSLLATLDPAGARQALAPRGWRVLRGR